MSSETLVAAPAPAPTGGLHTPTLTSSTTPTLISTSPVIFPPIHGRPLFKVPDLKTAETEYDTINRKSAFMFIHINKANYLGYLLS